ncbi:MAG: hypothetical protein WCC17_00240 [Candidatus Nitrosopolaris sp.]
MTRQLTTINPATEEVINTYEEMVTKPVKQQAERIAGLLGITLRRVRPKFRKYFKYYVQTRRMRNLKKEGKESLKSLKKKLKNMKI